MNKHLNTNNPVKPTDTNKVGRPTEAEYERRIQIIFNMLLESTSRPEMLEYSRKTWNLNHAAVDNMITEATKRIIEITDKERAGAYATANQQLQMMLNRSLSVNDIKTALAIRRELNELQRLKELPGAVTITQNTFHLSEKDKELL